MKLNKLKQILALFFIVSLFFLSASFVSANDIQKRGLETKYPIINGIEITATSTISEYAVYLFSIAMIIGAILALAVLTFGGFRYLTSAGNPEAMGDAKKWILESILGLVLLLCAWFIIGIINKEILKPKVEELKETSGIYLIDKNGEKIHSAQKEVNIPDYFEVKEIEFISGPPTNIYLADPNKDELSSVFIYSEKGLKGDVEEIKNTGAETKHDISDVGSIFLLWQEPGIYFYKQEGYDKDFDNPPRPKFLDGSQTSLKEDFDNEIKSLKIVNVKPEDASSGQTPGGAYYTILFEHRNFNKELNGRCAFAITSHDSIEGDIYDQIKGKISSIMIFRIGELHGELKIHDEIHQKGHEFARELEEMMKYYTLSDTEQEEVKIWNSIAITGNAIVIINTEEEGIHTGYCRPFSIGSKDGEDLKETSIYHESISGYVEEYFPKRATVFPRQE